VKTLINKLNRASYGDCTKFYVSHISMKILLGLNLEFYVVLLEYNNSRIISENVKEMIDR